MNSKDCVTAIIRFPVVHHEQAKDLFRKIVQRSRQDEGCLRFVAYEDKETEGVFTLNEEWADEASLQAHLASEHVQASFRAIEALGGTIENIWCREL